MVDVSAKRPALRIAVAQSVIHLPDPIPLHFKDGDIQSAKGPVFATAIVAGTLAAKKTSSLIPFCHPIGLERCKINIAMNDAGEAVVTCEVGVEGKTGVEMEALTGATVAALTVYDMCKALSHHIVIKETKLLSKTGGKSDFISSNTSPAADTRHP